MIICLVSVLVSLRVAYRVNKELHKKDEGTFSVTVLGQKEISVNVTKRSVSYDRLSDQDVSLEESTDTPATAPSTLPGATAGESLLAVEV